MYAVQKIRKPLNERCDDFESTVAQAVLEIEMNSDLKDTMRLLHLTGAKRISCVDKEAIVLYVPPPQLPAYKKIHQRFTREMEKKFSGKTFVIAASRRMLPKQTRKLKNKQTQKRPRSRTLTAVHEALLDDICYPAEIVGKQTHIRMDGSRVMKVQLDKSKQNDLNEKLTTLATIYKKLTGKEVTFEFPEWTL